MGLVFLLVVVLPTDDPRAGLLLALAGVARGMALCAVALLNCHVCQLAQAGTVTPCQCAAQANLSKPVCAAAIPRWPCAGTAVTVGTALAAQAPWLGCKGLPWTNHWKLQNELCHKAPRKVAAHGVIDEAGLLGLLWL